MAPCKVGDLVKAKVIRPYNGHEATIHGEVIAVTDQMFRVMYMTGRYMDFTMDDIGKTVTIKPLKGEF